MLAAAHSLVASHLSHVKFGHQAFSHPASQWVLISTAIIWASWHCEPYFCIVVVVVGDQAYLDCQTVAVSVFVVVPGPWSWNLVVFCSSGFSAGN